MENLARRIGSFFVDTTETIVIALSVWLVAYLFLGHGTQIYGSSMEPTFHDKQCVFTDIVSYRFHDPVRGDVISLHAPPAANCVTSTGCDFFKRIIGLPGENVGVHDGHYYINGKILTESYIPTTTTTFPGPFLESRGDSVTLTNNEFFVSGDNREHSSDSRFFGPITRSDIIGKAIYRYCPAKDVGPLPQATY